MRCLLALLVAAVAAHAADVLVSATEIAAANQRAAKEPGARAAKARILSAAEKAVAAPLNVPDRGGQWSHWYSCKKDGARLVTDSPTRHRCPVCGEIYSGEPYDSVVIGETHQRNAATARSLALAYRFTGRAEFRDQAVRLLIAYADRYKKYPRHTTRGEDKVGGGKLLAQTLDESVWLIPIAQSYGMVSAEMTAEDRRHVENDLLLPAADTIREHRMGIHNIQCWKNSAVGIVGFVTGRKDLVSEAIDDPERGFKVQIAKGVTEDGLWWEVSSGYHTYTMQALWPLAEAARHAGIDLYSAQYAKLFDAPLAMALPDGTPPGFNDSAGANIAAMANLYEIAYARWAKPAYGKVAAASRRDSLEALLFGAANPPAGSTAMQESTILRDSGIALLRGANITVAERWGRHGGGHGHPDKLNIVTFANGKLFGLDPGTVAYGVPLYTEWYRTTIAHNTVAVDGQNQAAVDGAAERWLTEGNVTRFTAAAAGAYPGVTLRRDLRLTAKLLEDRFDCESETEHVYDWAFHSAGTLTVSVKPVAGGEPLPYKHVSNVARVSTSEDWWAEWNQGGVKMRLRFKGAPATEIITATGPGRDPNVPVPMLIVRRKAARTQFEVTHEWPQ